MSPTIIIPGPEIMTLPPSPANSSGHFARRILLRHFPLCTMEKASWASQPNACLLVHFLLCNDSASRRRVCAELVYLPVIHRCSRRARAKAYTTRPQRTCATSLVVGIVTDALTVRAADGSIALTAGRLTAVPITSRCSHAPYNS